MFHLFPSIKEIKLEELDEDKIKMLQIVEDNVSDVICIVNREGIVTYVSPSIFSVLGYSISEYKGEIAFNILHPEDKEQIALLHEKALNTGKPFFIEYRAKHKNGEWKVIESKVVPVIHDSNIPRYVVIVARDVTDRKKAEELSAKIEKLMVAGQLARGFAHHVRNPLTSIKGFFKLVESKIENEEILTVLTSEINQIETTIKEYLALANPNINLVQRCNVVTIMTEVIEILKQEAHFNNVEFAIHIENNNISMIGDKNQLKVAFVNIVENAIESMTKGGIISIFIGCSQDHQICVEIADQGCGIEPDIISKLGEPLFTLRDKGTGIGLMLSFRIIYEHNGRIEFKSKQGVGTKVSIKLPLSQS
ncbi:ATP-binding protein [Bacillus sp. CGMCC 1.16607]|uniref:ATP-binding protein n=1 Tax=Bacillus sp. CGMCC 1.16607 TaxID=3351842 RepID=UPI0036398B9A